MHHVWCMKEGERFDSCQALWWLNLGSVKIHHHNVMGPRPHEPGIEHWGAPWCWSHSPRPKGCRAWMGCAPRMRGEVHLKPHPLKGWGAGFKHWAVHPIALHCTAEGSALLCIAMHSLHTYTRTREKFSYATFSNFSREGGDLHDQILSVKTGKNERKLGENVVFWAFSWKMVKYFIEIFR